VRQKLQDPGVWRLKTPGSWSFEVENSRILEFWHPKHKNFCFKKKLKIASKIFLKGRIDEKKKLAYAQ